MEARPARHWYAGPILKWAASWMWGIVVRLGAALQSKVITNSVTAAVSSCLMSACQPECYGTYSYPFAILSRSDSPSTEGQMIRFSLYDTRSSSLPNVMLKSLYEHASGRRIVVHLVVPQGSEVKARDRQNICGTITRSNLRPAVQKHQQ